MKLCRNIIKIILITNKTVPPMISVITKINDTYYKTNFVLTEKNLLVFYDITNGDPVWGTAAMPLPELYILFSIPIKNIKYEIREDNLYIILDKQEINCYDFNLDEFLNN